MVLHVEMLVVLAIRFVRFMMVVMQKEQTSQPRFITQLPVSATDINQLTAYKTHVAIPNRKEQRKTSQNRILASVMILFETLDIDQITLDAHDLAGTQTIPPQVSERYDKRCQQDDKNGRKEQVE